MPEEDAFSIVCNNKLKKEWEKKNFDIYDW